MIRSIMEVHWSSKAIGKSSNLFESTPQPLPFSTEWRRVLWMNSSMAEQSPVKRQDESSNLSSSAFGGHGPLMSCWQTWLYAFDCKSKERSSNLLHDSGSFFEVIEVSATKMESRGGM
jgi:hypothetical protein